MNKLIVVLVDGLGADWFAAHRSSLPCLDDLTSRGHCIERLQPEFCATSMPGRASVLTGMAAAEHGIYGNVIWDGTRFRAARPADLRAATIASLAQERGLRVASAGFGMAEPSHCHLHHRPYWDYQDFGCPPGQSYEQWLPVTAKYDAAMLELAVEMSSHSDLVLTEIAAPDYYLHYYGCDDDVSVAACRRVDDQLSEFTHSLDKCLGTGAYNVVVVSDHGFAEVTESIHADVILGDADLSCEGGVLHVYAPTQSEHARHRQALEAHGVLPLDNAYLPADQRNSVRAYTAPRGCDFYADYLGRGRPRGPSRYRANHGFAPGADCDERFAVFSGPAFAAGVRRAADAPTVFRMLQGALDAQ